MSSMTVSQKKLQKTWIEETKQSSTVKAIRAAIWQNFMFSVITHSHMSIKASFARMNRKMALSTHCGHKNI